MDSPSRNQSHAGWIPVLTGAPRMVGRWAARNPDLLLCLAAFTIPQRIHHPEARHAVWLLLLTAMSLAIFYGLLWLPGWEGVQAAFGRLLRRRRGRGQGPETSSVKTGGLPEP